MSTTHIKPRIRNSIKNCRKKSPIQKEKSKYLKHIYCSKTWKTLRREYISEHSVCECCKINVAESVHHVIPFSTGETKEEIQQLAYDKDNLKALCKSCHFMFHRIKHEFKNSEPENQNTDL